MCRRHEGFVRHAVLRLGGKDLLVRFVSSTASGTILGGDVQARADMRYRDTALGSVRRVPCERLAR